jgi:superfamily II DNA/RNA helicase
MHKLIGAMLKEHGVGFAELNGTVPANARGALIKTFEDDQNCKVFLSTEAGGAGLNLQVADILINFELPWNPAKKNQRIGRIDRLGQRSTKLNVFNLIARDSIEQHIAAGLLVKQSLFDGVLSPDNTVNYVDFSSKGRSQFIMQLEAMVTQPAPDEMIAETEPQSVRKAAETAAEMEQVLNSGMQFLSLLFKMSTGTDHQFKNQKIEIDPATGEVCLRFKMGAGNSNDNEAAQ